MTENAAPGVSKPLAAQPAANGPAEVAEVDRELGKAKRKNALTDAKLRQWLGFGALGAMAIQLVVADVAFFVYGFMRDWTRERARARLDEILDRVRRREWRPPMRQLASREPDPLFKDFAERWFRGIEDDLSRGGKIDYLWQLNNHPDSLLRGTSTVRDNDRRGRSLQKGEARRESDAAAQAAERDLHQ